MKVNELMAALRECGSNATVILPISVASYSNKELARIDLTVKKHKSGAFVMIEPILMPELRKKT